MERYDYFVKKVKDYNKNNKIYILHSESIIVAFALSLWWREGLLARL